eukprot:CAMPEP_0185787664 /NCGR_PEP_ID=MMETSP1174-20130828/142010_1 /TAXON_ID=35687 /ORGANISM="Dictyocha speculum, Strain CCMP1381" /LENGTH=75 /DNA_ID=CAMNT_0028480933 /DNA_START=86 /DNA_END=313 /DNA_ORIENTATION=-
MEMGGETRGTLVLAADTFGYDAFAEGCAEYTRPVGFEGNIQGRAEKLAIKGANGRKGGGADQYVAQEWANHIKME